MVDLKGLKNPRAGGILEWGWNAHAVTYYVSTKVGQRGTRFLVGGGGGGWWLVGGWWYTLSRRCQVRFFC